MVIYLNPQYKNDDISIDNKASQLAKPTITKVKVMVMETTTKSFLLIVVIFYAHVALKWLYST